LSTREVYQAILKGKAGLAGFVAGQASSCNEREVTAIVVRPKKEKKDEKTNALGNLDFVPANVEVDCGTSQKR